MESFATTVIKELPTLIHRESVGLNLCRENAEELLELQPDLDFIQVHPEHLMQEEGGVYRSQVDELMQLYPVMFHGFGLSLGSSAVLDRNYLDFVRRLLVEYPSSFFSDHVSWSSLSNHHFHDLIPLVMTDETLEYMSERIGRVQDWLQAPILIENISSYFRFKESTYSEVEFINQLTRNTGCFVLLDLNNLWANAMNFGEEAATLLNHFSHESVRAIHLAGCTLEQKKGGSVYIDYHKEAVHEPVWELYKQALQLCGPWPTLIEWENDVPPLKKTLEEVERIRQSMSAYKQTKK